MLAINAGSSSLKFALYEVNVNNKSIPILQGSFDGLEYKSSLTKLKYKYKDIVIVKEYVLDPNENDVFINSLTHLYELLISIDIPIIKAISHRIVHGGIEFIEPVISSNEILDKLKDLLCLAPLHQLHGISIVTFFSNVYPEIPQVLCFDTSFHSTLSINETLIPISREITNQGIVRRYGFHGISYQYIIGELIENSSKAKGKVLMLHIGSGASLCACLNTKSIATTMGFATLDGVMMGTRSGTIDTGVLLYLINQGYNYQELNNLLYKNSGLLGVSGISADMRVLKVSNSPLAQEAINLFTYNICQKIGSMIQSLEGIDIISFSGGLAENDSLFRLNICKKLKWLGLNINEELNNNANNSEILKISNSDSQIEAWIIPTNEEIMIAKEASKFLT